MYMNVFLTFCGFSPGWLSIVFATGQTTRNAPFDNNEYVSRNGVADVQTNHTALMTSLEPRIMQPSTAHPSNAEEMTTLWVACYSRALDSLIGSVPPDDPKKH